MTDKTPPIIDIQGLIFWDEVQNPQTLQLEMRPVRTEIRYQREGFDEWEVLRYQNVVPDRMAKFNQPPAPAEEPKSE